MATKSNRLTLLQTYRLMGWLESNKEIVQKRSGPELARQITSELGFLVNGDQVLLARNQLGIKVNSRPNATKGIACKFAILAEAIADLADAMGEDVSEDIKAMMRMNATQA